MYKKIATICWLLVLLSLIFTSRPCAQHFVRITEEGSIQLAMDYFIKAVQKTDTATVLAWLGTETMVKDTTIDPGPQIRSIFERASRRQTSIAPPPGAQNRRFWDLEITKLSIEVDDDSTEALVKCELTLWAAETDKPRTACRTSETFIFNKTTTGWKLAGFDNLLDFLGKEVSQRE